MSSMARSHSYVTEYSTTSANISLLVITTAFALARVLVSAFTGNLVKWDQLWFVAAFACYLALSIMYLVVTPLFFKIAGVATGQTPVYAEITEDEGRLRRLVFPATTLLWLVLWLVKFSLLAFYKQLVAKLVVYMRLWFIVVVTCVLCLLASILSHIFACGPNVMATFTPGQCGRQEDLRGIVISLWLAYAADVLTDLLVMALPIGLVKKARLPLRQKLSVGVLFCLGLVCVTIATIRVCEIGRTISATSVPSVTWLTLWAIVESSCAIIIGSAPGLFRGYKSYIASRAPVVEAGYSDLSNSRAKTADNYHLSAIPMVRLPEGPQAHASCALAHKSSDEELLCSGTGTQRK